MCCHDTAENDRTKLTKETLKSLSATVDFNKHRLFIFNNNSCPETLELLEAFSLRNFSVKIINATENIGTARGINACWVHRNPDEHCLKLDNDIIIHSDSWVEEMEAAILTEPQIGIVGLKRKDIWQYPGHPEKQYRTELLMLPHTAGEQWRVVERSKDIIGTCTMFNSLLLDKIGYLFQPGVYGFDDVLASYRSEIAGFINVFLPYINIDHIDPGGTEYIKWKEREAAIFAPEIIKIVDQYISGERPIYEPCA